MLASRKRTREEAKLDFDPEVEENEDEDEDEEKEAEIGLDFDHLFTRLQAEQPKIAMQALEQREKQLDRETQNLLVSPLGTPRPRPRWKWERSELDMLEAVLLQGTCVGGSLGREISRFSRAVHKALIHPFKAETKIRIPYAFKEDDPLDAEHLQQSLDGYCSQRFRCSLRARIMPPEYVEGTNFGSSGGLAAATTMIQVIKVPFRSGPNSQKSVMLRDMNVNAKWIAKSTSILANVSDESLSESLEPGFFDSLMSRPNIICASRALRNFLLNVSPELVIWLDLQFDKTKANIVVDDDDDDRPFVRKKVGGEGREKVKRSRCFKSDENEFGGETDLEGTSDDVEDEGADKKTGESICSTRNYYDAKTFDENIARLVDDFGSAPEFALRFLCARSALSTCSSILLWEEGSVGNALVSTVLAQAFRELDAYKAWAGLCVYVLFRLGNCLQSYALSRRCEFVL